MLHERCRSRLDPLADASCDNQVQDQVVLAVQYLCVLRLDQFLKPDARRLALPDARDGHTLQYVRPLRLFYY